MAFQVSPGVNVSEIDTTTVVPAVSTSTGAVAGTLGWGPVLSPRLVTNELELVQLFGKPDSTSYLTFFTAANFLSYSNSLYVARAGASGLNTAVALSNTSNVANVTINNEDDYFNNWFAASNAAFTFAARYPGSLGNTLKVAFCANTNTTAFSTWAYQGFFDKVPGTSNWVSVNANTAGNDEMHVVVVDEDGLISGTAGTILEKYPNLSKAPNAKDESGQSIYYRDVLYRSSKYVVVLGHNNASWGVTANATHVYTGENSNGVSLSLGTDGTAVDGNVTAAYAQFASKDNVDISLVMAGGANQTVAANVATLADSRRDCLAFISPLLANTQAADPTNSITAFRNGLTSTSFAVMDSGWKYQYDRYNDVYRWIPCNGDVAGLCARTDTDRDPWFSPAGFNRGQLRNVIKLAFNPNQAQRDSLYKSGVNPIVSFPGEGTVLYGDKTLLSRPSAFDRINVRRLFIVLEKAIERAARTQLFEFNDEFTRAQFVNLVEPFLRLVQGRRGIYDFRVVCDETNNTPEVIDRNEFVGDIYIKPAKSINFIQLNFVAVRTGVSFEEVVGRF